MGFTQNNNFNNNQPTLNKKKVNFNIGRSWGKDGQLDMSVWLSDSGVRTILRIKQAVGKDPSTGSNVFEQKQPNELPAFFMNIDELSALIDAIEECKDPGSIAINITKPSGDNLTINGEGSSIKITIYSKKKDDRRTITLDSISTGTKNVHATFNVFADYLRIAYKKSKVNKLDPDEFGMVTGESDSDEQPF